MRREAFDERLRVIHDHLMGGSFDECVSEARALRTDLASDPKPNAERTGWALFYELKGLYETRRHDEIAELVASYDRDAAPMSYKNESWLYSAGAETARLHDKPDDVVRWGRMAATIAMRAEDADRAFRAATAAAWLLRDMDRDDLNDEFALFLIEEGGKRADARALADGVAHLTRHFNRSRRGELVRYIASRPEWIHLAIQGGQDGFASMLESWFAREDVLEALEPERRQSVGGTLAMVRAASDGDLDRVGKAIRAGGRVNDTDIVAGRTALMAASLAGQAQVVDVLLDAGADPNIRNPQGRTALVMAADHGHLGIVIALLDRGADPLVGDAAGVTALHAAAVGGFAEIVALMLDRGVDVDYADEYGNTALIRAASMGHVGVMAILVDRGAEIDARGSRKVTPLIAAAQECRLDAVRWLVDQGADPECRDANNMAALDWADYVGDRDETMRASAEAVTRFLREG